MQRRKKIYCPIQPGPTANAKPFPSNILGDLSRPSMDHSSNSVSNTSRRRLFHSLIGVIARKFFQISCLKCFCAEFEPIAQLPVLSLPRTSIPLPCMAMPFACRPGMPLGRVSILYFVTSSALDRASVVFLRHNPTTVTCVERIGMDWGVIRAWSTQHGAVQLKISLASLKMK